MQSTNNTVPKLQDDDIIKIKYRLEIAKLKYELENLKYELEKSEINNEDLQEKLDKIYELY